MRGVEPVVSFAVTLIGDLGGHSALRDQLVAFGHGVVELNPDGDLVALTAGIPPDLVLVELDGARAVPVVRRVRRRSNAPIVVVSGIPGEQAAIQTLDAGADDFLVGCSRGEMFARMRALVRRARAAVPDELRVIEVGRLRVDPSGHQAALSGRALQLTRYELRVLVSLARSVGRVLSIDELVRATWGRISVDRSDNLRGLIASIRRKIEADPAHPRWLVNKFGAGYCLHGDPQCP